MKKIMITGALGQIGTELVVKCREIYGTDNVLLQILGNLKQTHLYKMDHLKS